MKKLIPLISALLLFLLSMHFVVAQSGDVTLEYRASATQAKAGEEVTIDVVLKNPSRQNIISARTWFTYNTAHLEGIAVETKDSLFTLAAPGEDGFDASQGYVKIGRSNISGGMKEAETVVAKVKFRVKTSSPVTTTLEPYDYQVTELGHTSINIIEQGFPVNVLTQKPKALTLALNGGESGIGGSGGTTGTSESATGLPFDLERQRNQAIGYGLLRPTNVRVNTGSGYADLKWDLIKDRNRVGFHVYYGKVSGQYSRRRTIENINRVRIDGLNNDSATFFAVTAYDALNQESDYSDEVAIIINEPLSSTAPFAGVLEASLRRLPGQPQNGPLTWWILFSAVGLSGTLIFRRSPIRE